MLGVDDWALKRGQRYGTILVDLERHAVIDLLPDREAATFAAWLTTHPGVKLISRDRGGAYAEGARQGAPDAIQIADHFHLVKNLMAALGRACTRHHPTLRTAAEATRPTPRSTAAVRKRRYSGLPHNRPGPTEDQQQSAERRARRLARYEQVVALRAGGMPKHQIAEAVGLTRGTVSTWLAAGRFPERVPRVRCPHRLDRYAPYILERYRAGLHNAAQLARELRGRGYTGPDQTVSRYLSELRQIRARAAPAPPPRVSAPTPSPRETAWLLRTAAAKPETLTIEEQAYVEALGISCPPLAKARTLVAAFVQMLEHHDAAALDPWLTAAEASELRSFAAGLRREHDAVLAAVLFSWSNGQAEGQVNRVKLLKRAMYGRASFALLRKRVLRAP